MARRGLIAERDQAPTGFTEILQHVVDATPGALGAALVDAEGETVDYAGALDTLDIRLAAAHMQLEFRHAATALERRTGRVRGLVVRSRMRSFVVRDLVDGYLIVVVLGRSSAFRLSERAVAQAEYELRVEGGWEPPSDVERWMHLRVEATGRNKWRPRRVCLTGQWRSVEVLGTVVGLAEGEIGYRVRTVAGVETTLVRERSGRWYGDIRLP